MGQASNRLWIGGVPVDRFTAADWAQLMLADWRRKKKEDAPPKVVTTVNGQVIALFAQNREYREAVLAADHVAADGMSVVLASKLATQAPLPERVATTDWFHVAAKAASRNGMRFFLLGATPDANERAKRRAKKLYPFLNIVGSLDGYFDRQRIEDVAQQVADCRTDVLWLGIGNPQQLFLAHTFKHLIPGLTWIRTCGGLFDFLSGDRSRAPSAIQAMGLEWVYRVALEPRRLAWRYATTNVQAIYAMARDTHGGEPRRA